jgi:hypothetical protein
MTLEAIGPDNWRHCALAAGSGPDLRDNQR